MSDTGAIPPGDDSVAERTEPLVGGSQHLVQFYEDDDFLFAAVAKFLGDGMAAGDSLLVIATEAHQRAFRQQLESAGFDVVRACKSGQLTFLDAQQTLSKFMTAGEPDHELFELAVGCVVSGLVKALPGAGRLRAYGEMVDLLWQDGERKAAIAVEQLWNDLQSRHEFTLLCAYAMASFYKEPAVLYSVCATHTHIIGDPGLGQHGAAPDVISTPLPPQFARRLAQEIARREQVERALRDTLIELQHKGKALRANQETLDARRRAEQLYRFAHAVVEAERVEEVYAAALSAIETALGAPRSAVLTLGSDQRMHFRAWRNLSDDYRAAVDGHSPWPADAVAPEPVLVPDASSDPAMTAYVPLFAREGIGALAFVPLVTGGRLLGKFMLYYERPHAFVSHELETAKTIANHLASVIARFGAAAKLEETIRANELFAGALAHDLRNPLTAMMMAGQIILARGEGENVKGDSISKALGRILSSGRRMATMIDQLLDFTRARAGGGIAIEPRQTNLAELCTQAVGELEVAHPEWKIHRTVVGDPIGSWDSERLLQVLSNLVANAGQHGPRGGGIAIALNGEARHHVRVDIHNNGTVPQSLLPHLFDPFRSTGPRRDQSRGLGLGLFIVREIVRAHGGTVEVASSEAAGTTFSILLPRDAGPTERSAG